LFLRDCLLQENISTDIETKVVSLATELGDRIRVIKIDVDQNTELAGSSEVKYKQAGVHTKPQLMKVLLNML
jgi:hypothetical protein